jgi:hypothetical protein
MAFLAGIGLSGIFSAVGTVVSAVGAMASASAQANAANYNAKVNDNNAKTALDHGAAEATNIAAKNKQRMAAIRAGTAENGMDLSGSALDVVQAANKQGTMDGLTAIWDSTTRAIGYRNSAELDRMQASAASSAGALGAFSSIFDGFSRAFA